MTHKTFNRREVLERISKTGIGMSTAPLFFLSLKTAPLSDAFAAQPALSRAKPVRKPVPGGSAEEKALISGQGSKITVKISGSAGRHCGLAFAVSNTPSAYKAVRNGRGTIGRNGVCIIKIDTDSLPDGRVFLRAVTGSSRDFSRDARGTETFELEISGGRISGFKGVRERVLSNTKTLMSAAAAGYNPKLR